MAKQSEAFDLRFMTSTHFTMDDFSAIREVVKGCQLYRNELKRPMPFAIPSCISCVCLRYSCRLSFPGPDMPPLMFSHLRLLLYQVHGNEVWSEEI
jgi:hypothetical protein